MEGRRPSVRPEQIEQNAARAERRTRGEADPREVHFRYSIFYSVPLLGN
mgnify:CR=1 FL=1